MDEKLIQRLANTLYYKPELDELHDSLISQGYTEEQFFLLIQAAKVLLKGRFLKEEEMEQLEEKRNE